MRGDSFTTTINLINEIEDLGGNRREIVSGKNWSGHVIEYIHDWDRTDFVFDSLDSLCSRLRARKERCS